MPSPSALPSMSRAMPPSAINALDKVLWKGVLRISGAGSQTRVAPEDFRISTRVFTSNVRQPSDVAPSASRQSVLDNARLADTTPADRTKSRRFTDETFRPIFDTDIAYSASPKAPS